MIWILWLWASLAFGHGGIPQSGTISWDANGELVLGTSHGLIFESGEWDWVCEEVIGVEAFVMDMVHTQQALVFATTNGLVTSTTGCDWSWSESLSEQVVWEVAIDVNKPERVWVAAEAGLSWSDDQGANFTLEVSSPEDFSLRSFIQRASGEFTLLGFVGGQPTARIEAGGTWTAIDLPVSAGTLRTLGTDANDNVYAQFPSASGPDQLLRIAVDGSVHSVFQSDSNIYDLVVVDETLVASVAQLGTFVSTDQGDTWSLEDERQPRCLSAHDGQIWACPGDQSKVLWIRTSLSSLSAGDPWTEGPSFEDVSGQRCGEVLEECDALWPQVEEQLSQSALSDTTEAVSDEDPEAGCRGRSGSAMLILPWWLLSLGGRLRRSSGGSVA